MSDVLNEIVKVSGKRSIAAGAPGADGVWSPDFRVNDRLVAPLQEQIGKA